MSTPPLRAATVGGTADEVEAQFYDALQKGDVAALMACWADEDEIVCIHPDGPCHVGPGAIRAAYEALFAHGAPRIRTDGVRRVEALAASVHTVVEHREPAQAGDGGATVCMIATNVYHRTAQGWRLVAHHASPGTAADAAAPRPADALQTLH